MSAVPSTGNARPTRIDQIIPSIVEHDAVSNHTFGAQRLLRSMGFCSEIYSNNIGPGLDGAVEPLGRLARLGDGSQWVLYQSSIGSPAAKVFAAHPGPKILDYHNITPAELVERWLPPLAAEARLGRAQLQELAPLVGYAIADSPFNARELQGYGYARTRVVSVLLEAGNFDAPANPAWLQRLQAKKVDGGKDWLFVGQLSAHKAQHDVIKAFVCYRQVFDDRARLHLVGREMGAAYKQALGHFIAELGLQDSVELVGSVPTDVLAAYYESADVFVCCSDHEGFCAPIVEAMARGLPVVGYGAAAVPDTIGEGGIVLPRKDAALVAAAAHEVLQDSTGREALVSAGRARAASFALPVAEEAFRQAIKEALAVAS